MEIADRASMERTGDVVFQPALTALEAAMLPAKPPKPMGALSHVKAREAKLWSLNRECGRASYRQKIWVR